MKNANGTGGIVNLGKHRRKPYAVRVTQGWIDGKQLYQYIGYYATRKEAQKALAEYTVDPHLVVKSKLTFADLWNDWSPGGLKGLSRQTHDSYRAAFANLSPLHNRQFTEIRTAEIQSVIDDSGKGYSSRTNMKVVCSYLYKYAIQNDIVQRDYSQYIRVGKNEKKEKTVFTDIEIQRLFENDTLPYADTVLILLYTGFRVQEFLNIRKCDVDFNTGIITGGLKTEAGRDRAVPIHPKIIKYVKARYDACTEPFGKLTHVSQTNYRKHFDELMTELGITSKTPHCTRHTFATIMGREGVDALAITQILGHSNYNFTVKNYTHTDVDYLTEQLKKVN